MRNLPDETYVAVTQRGSNGEYPQAWFGFRGKVETLDDARLSARRISERFGGKFGGVAIYKVTLVEVAEDAP